MDSRKVCIVVQNYYEIDPRVQREADALTEFGYQVDVLALRYSQHPQKEYSSNNVRVFTISVEKKRAGKLSYIAEYLLFFILVSFRLAQRSLKQRYHIIHVCTPPDFLVFATMIPKLLGAKIILDIHDVMPEFYSTKFNVPEDHWIIRIIKLQEKLSTRFADYVITANELFKEILISRGLFSSKVTVINNLPDENIFRGGKDFKWPRSNQHGIKLIYTGTIGERHGLQTAIKGLALLVDHIPDIHLQIVGNGDYKSELIELTHSLDLEKYVSFNSPVPLEEIPDLLLNSDIGICLQEGKFNEIAFPTKVPEYMSMNLPVVVSETRITRLYFDPEMVVFVPPADPEVFASNIRELYENPAATMTLIMNAQQFSSKWSWKTEKLKYLNVINSLVA